MRRLIGFGVSVLALAVLGCPGGGDDKPVYRDKGGGVIIKKDQGRVTTYLDRTPVARDTKPTLRPDTGSTTSSCGTPFTAKVNTGKSCTADVNSCSADEVCVGFKNAAGADVAMCLGKCCFDEGKAWNDPFNMCPMTDAAKQLSDCEIILKDDSNACAWVCQYKDQQGTYQKFSCPDATNFDCVAVWSDDPDTKYCVPKK